MMTSDAPAPKNKKMGQVESQMCGLEHNVQCLENMASEVEAVFSSILFEEPRPKDPSQTRVEEQSSLAGLADRLRNLNIRTSSVLNHLKSLVENCQL